jgi:hypothetical protein
MTAAATPADPNSGFIFIWLWILVAGITIFGVVTAMGVKSGKP